MYTVGQVAKFLGMSRDTLKFYEEKHLIHPMQDKENGYRKYSLIDINEILTINFYRDIDIEIKNIQAIKEGTSLEEIEAILSEKEKSLEQEITYKKLLLKRTRIIKQNCKAIEESLNQFSIREMKPIIITSEIKMDENIEHIYSEVLQKYDYSTRIKKVVNLSGLSRIVYFDHKGVTEERYVFFENSEHAQEEKREVITYPKCIYIVIEVPSVKQENNIDENMAATITQQARALGYEPLGVAFINLLINSYKEGINNQYLEIYTPIK